VLDLPYQETALLYNSYPMEQVWDFMQFPAEQLRKVGFDVTLIQRPKLASGTGNILLRAAD